MVLVVWFVNYSKYRYLFYCNTSYMKTTPTITKVRSCVECVHINKECFDRINGFKLYIQAMSCFKYKRKK